MSKGIIYYTNNRVNNSIFVLVQKFILDSKLPIISVSLEKINFGKNIVYNGISGYISMIKQIIIALKNSKDKYVFFCEHDVLYHPSHFDFTPTRDNIWYYNKNNWRWFIGSDIAIRYDRMISLSGLCVNREFALDHYKQREVNIEQLKDSFRSHEPSIIRKWGYEPGTKKKKRGGFSDDDYETWDSKYPNIDIRHNQTFSRPKTKLHEFKHAPVNFEEIKIENIAGWELKKIFNI